jgi:hypothetical protein
MSSFLHPSATSLPSSIFPIIVGYIFTSSATSLPSHIFPIPLCYIFALKNLSSPPQLQITRAAITSLAKPSFINILCSKTHLKILYKLNPIYDIFPCMYPAPVRLTGSLLLYDMPTLSGSQEVPTPRLLLRLDNTPPTGSPPRKPPI